MSADQCECEMGWQCDFCRQFARGYNGNVNHIKGKPVEEVPREFKLKTDIGYYEPHYDKATLLLWADGTVTWRE